MKNLDDNFKRRFELVRADTPVLLDEALRLRFQVYCLENGYENPSQFQDVREYDSYDLHSVHSLVRHKETGLPTGNVRLILPKRKNADFHFPIQDCVPPQLISNDSSFIEENLGDWAEISRFCVSKDFKQSLGKIEPPHLLDTPPEELNELDVLRKLDGSYPATGMRSDARLLPQITIGLIAATFHMSAEEGIKYWFAMMEPSLLRLLTRFGIYFTPIGDVIEHRGRRQPCFAHIQDVADGIWGKRPDVWRLVTKDGALWDSPEKAQPKLVSVK